MSSSSAPKSQSLLKQSLLRNTLLSDVDPELIDSSDAVPPVPRSRSCSLNRLHYLYDAPVSPPQQSLDDGDKVQEVPKKKGPNVFFATVLSAANIGPTSSIFFILPLIMEDAGAVSIWSVALSGVFCWSLAVIVAEYAKFVPSSGSFHAYVALGLGPRSGLFTAWIMMFAYALLAMQALLQVAGWLSDIIMRWSGFEWPWPITVIALGLLVGFLIMRGVSQSLWACLVFFTFAMIIVVATCLAFIALGTPFVPWFTKENTPKGAAGFAQSLVFGIMLFNGFEGATSLGQHVDNPEKVVSRAVVGSIYAVQVLIGLGAYAFACAIGPEHASDLIDITSPADYYARKFVGRWFAAFVDLAGVTASMTLTLAQISFNIAVLQSLGEGKMLGLSYFGKTVGDKRIAVRSIVGSMIFYVFLALGMGFLCAGFGRRRDPAAFFATTGCWDAFNLVTEVASIALLLVYLSPNASICAFVRKYHPHRYRPFLHKVLPIINIVAGIGYIVSQFFPPPDVLDIICIVVFAVYCLIGGVVVYRSNVDLETVAAC